MRKIIRIAAIFFAFACGDSTSPPPPPPGVIYVVTPTAFSAAVGSDVLISAQLTDADQNPSKTAGRVVTWSSRTIPGPGSGSGSFSSPTSTTNSDGIASVTFTLGTIAYATYQISVVDDELPGVASYASILSIPGPVAKYIVSTSVIEPPAGADVIIYAQAADAYGNPTKAQGRLVSWTKTGSGGSFAEPATSTDANGKASVAFTTSAVAGTTYTISGTDADGLRGTSPDINTQSQLSLVSIATGVGAISSCGLASSGAAWCWGAHPFGALGDGTTVDRSLPGKVSGNLTMTSLSAGYLYACGVTTSGSVQCWGDNRSGQLGDNTTTSHPVPAPIASSLTFTSVATSSPFLIPLPTHSAHTCALATGGDAYCWGSNANGQMGDGSQNRATQPVKVGGGLSFASISAGGLHTCGVTTDRDAYCWGSNSDGQLGDNSLTDRSTPGAVAGGLKFIAVSAGGTRTCGIAVGGAAYCWGDSPIGQTSPAPVTGGLSFVAISVSGLHTCGITTTSTAWCWGINLTGQLGNPNFDSGASPTEVTGGLLFKSISAGGTFIQTDFFPHYRNFGHTCGVTTAGVTYCWGANEYGELGSGPTIVRSGTPLKVGGQP